VKLWTAVQDYSVIVGKQTDMNHGMNLHINESSTLDIQYHIIFCLLVPKVNSFFELARRFVEMCKLEYHQLNSWGQPAGQEAPPLSVVSDELHCRTDGVSSTHGVQHCRKLHLFLQ
jgi:hypothetical protein